MTKRYGVLVSGECRICGFQGDTEMNHIISQARCKKIGKEEWIRNEGNIVELCKNCHDNTTASMAHAKLNAKSYSKEYSFGGLDSKKCCIVYTKGKKSGKQCSRSPKAAHGLCVMHHRSLWIKKFYDSELDVFSEKEIFEHSVLREQ